MDLFLFSHAPPTDLFRQQVLRVAFAFFSAFERNIFKHHLYATDGGGVGDARTHHSGAQYTNLFEALFLYAFRAAAARINIIQLEPEGASHVFGDLTNHQFSKIAGFNQAAVIKAYLGAFNSRSHNALRRRITAFGFLLQHGGRNRQLLCHGRVVGRATWQLEAFLVPGLLAFRVGINKRPSLGYHVFRGDRQLVDNAGFQGSRRA